MKLKWFCSLGVALGFLLPVSAEYAEILIDGNFDDWHSIPSITNDPLDHVEGGIDFKEMWVANDNNYLYIRCSFHVPVNPFTWNMRTYIDGDNNPSTGWHPISSFGSEILMETTVAYQQAGGGWNESEGGLPNASILYGPTWGTVTQVEYRISRAIAGVTTPFTNVPLMSSDTIRILLQDIRGTDSDFMPDTQGVSYTFAPNPPPPSYYKKITVDGDFADWEGVPSLALAPANNLGHVDWKEMWIANDEEYLYIKYTLHEPFNPNNWNSFFFFDGDDNESSGYNIVGTGSEFLVIAGIASYQQAGGNWSSEGTLTNLDFLQSPYNTSATEFEFRIARAVTGVSGVFEGEPLLTSDTIRVLAYSEIKDANDNVITSKLMPSTKGALYAFALKPPPGGTILQVQ